MDPSKWWKVIRAQSLSSYSGGLGPSRTKSVAMVDDNRSAWKRQQKPFSDGEDPRVDSDDDCSGDRPRTVAAGMSWLVEGETC